MRAWTILMFLILFNMSLAVVGALNIWTVTEGTDEVNPLHIGSEEFVDNLTSFNYLSLFSGGILAAGLFATVALNLSFGAVVYTAVFSANLFWLNTFFDKVGSQFGVTIMPEFITLITVALFFTFLWGFIKLAS